MLDETGPEVRDDIMNQGTREMWSSGGDLEVREKMLALSFSGLSPSFL